MSNPELLKLLKKARKYVISPFSLGVLVTAGMTYVSSQYYARTLTVLKDDHSWISILYQLHEKTIDWRLADRGAAAGSDRVAILAVDGKAIEQEGRWPWSRDKQAKLVERALDYGAKSVSFDIVYSEEDQNSSAPALRRLRRTLGHPTLGTQFESKSDAAPKEVAEISAAIDDELSRDDGDRIFSQTIGRHADHLIMGSFFEEYDPVLPFQEFCSEALFQRSREARYWAKESRPILVQDDELKKLAFPKEIQDHIQEYITQLEVGRAADWFDSHKELIPKITENLEDMAPLLPPESYPALATLWSNNDLDSAKILLEAAKPELAKQSSRAAALFEIRSRISKKRSDFSGERFARCGNRLLQTILLAQRRIALTGPIQVDLPRRRGFSC